MPTALPIEVSKGTITVEAISGLVEENRFILYVTLLEKHAEASCFLEGLTTIVCIYPTSKTLRPIPNDVNRQGGMDGADGYEPVDISRTKRATQVELPGGWYVEASVSRYTCRIIGVRGADSAAMVDMPFTEAPFPDA